MKWATAVSEHRFLKYAVAECANAVKAALGERNPDLAVAFVSPHHAANYADLPALIRDMIGDCVLVGCSGGGVIGAGREVENRPGFSLAVAEMPGVEVAPFHIDNADLPDGDAPPQAWEELVSASAVDDPHFLLLSDPFSVQGENLLMGLDYAFPRSVKIGGLASGGQRPGANALYLGGRAYDSGAVGVALRGNITVDTIVAQGCRPIGERMQITESDRNLLIGLDGRGAIETLRELFRGLSERDQQLAQQSLFLGVVMDEFNDDPQLGDFLIRNIIGLDARQGALAIGEYLKEGQIVQFHLRDAETSSQDLNDMLGLYASGRGAGAGVAGTTGAGALLFQCLGRGEYLYGRADHDTDMFRDKVGAIPLAGFFCNGEIGQVSGQTYLHGYTSSFGVFRPKDAGTRM